uniref:C-type lectin domain-containing protein n=1 Tax=Cyprinodon variegatus TaxID=28743 RepID=A0A3Q2CYF6_CYPVA
MRTRRLTTPFQKTESGSACTETPGSGRMPTTQHLGIGTKNKMNQIAVGRRNVQRLTLGDLANGRTGTVGKGRPSFVTAVGTSLMFYGDLLVKLPQNVTELNLINQAVPSPFSAVCPRFIVTELDVCMSAAVIISYCFYLNPIKCFSGSNVSFVHIKTSMNWTEALSYCREHHTDLAIIRNLDENRKVNNTIPKDRVWIGLYRHTWKNQNKFTNWANYEPSNSEGIENCVQIYSDGFWNDEPCFQNMLVSTVERKNF